jgi:hypothetical protein
LLKRLLKVLRAVDPMPAWFIKECPDVLINPATIALVKSLYRGDSSNSSKLLHIIFTDTILAFIKIIEQFDNSLSAT